MVEEATQSGLLRWIPLLPLLAALDAPAEPPLLGRLFQARVDEHEMSRAELAEALSERGEVGGVLRVFRVPS